MNTPLEPTSWRDVLWGLVAAVSAVWFLQAIADAGLLEGVLLLAPAFFIVFGAWRRTIWGCPFSMALGSTRTMSVRGIPSMTRRTTPPSDRMRSVARTGR